MIMHDGVCDSMYRRYKNGDLRTGHFTKEFKNIFRWVLRYYKKHQKAPKSTIQNIYENRKKSLGPEQREITGAYLERLAEDYAQEEESGVIDAEYVANELLPDFMREREILYRLEKAQQKIEKGLVEEAEKTITEYNPILIEIEDENLGILMPLTRDDLKHSNKPLSDEDVVYRFEDNQAALGQILGNLRRGWLVAITGIEKAGKSYVMEEMGFNAAVYQNRKVLKINLELTETVQRERLWKRISATTDPWQIGDNIYPVFDCENNQYGTCKRKDIRDKSIQKILQRHRKTPLFTKPGEVVDFEKHKDWQICDYCRTQKIRKNQRETKRFLPTLFFDHSKLKQVSRKTVRRAMRRHERFANLDNYRIKCFPRFSVTFDGIRSYILRYIDKTGWVPDMILIDYLDITDDEHTDKRIDVDNKWKKASKLAGEINCLVLNADQANKAARTAYAIDKTSTSESKTKDGHLDVRFAINQMPGEKDFNIARINCLFHRHFDFNEQREVLITQRLEVSQPILDSVRIHGRLNNIRVSNKKYF